MKLKELEKRLEKEPANLGLRVTVAGLLREAGRSVEAVELYRSVAVAYRDQGRRQQAIAVCRSILEIAPDDVPCQGLLAALLASGAPVPAPAAPAVAPRPSASETPLPRPVPYHVADPTSSPQRVPPDEVAEESRADDVQTRPDERSRPGLAQAARRISGMITGDLADQVETRKRPRIAEDQLRKITQPPPTVPVPRVEPDADVMTPAVAQGAIPRDSEDELTVPREKLPPGEGEDPTR